MSRKMHSKEIVNKIFRKARTINGEDPNLWRLDRKGMYIYRPAYGDIHSSYGWNIHHKDNNPNNNSESNLEAVHYDTHLNLHLR